MKEPRVIETVPTATDVEQRDRGHQSAEVALGIVAFLVVAAAAFTAPAWAALDNWFTYVVAAVPVIWLVGCALYGGGGDPYV